MAKVWLTPGCWIWHAAKSKGYGLFQGSRAHRWAYERMIGEIPASLTLDHLCGNKSCVNPAHLEPVTRLENIRRFRERQANHEQAA